MKNTFKLQSAMEYLMTYGWAILIIAAVLGALYQMGAFNSSSLTVRVPSGACKVLRTSAAVNLVGQCSGILPKYVAVFSGAWIPVSVQSDGLGTNGATQLSAFAWFYVSTATTNEKIFSDYSSNGNGAFNLALLGSSTYTEFYLGGTNRAQSNLGTVTTGSWHQIGITWSNANSFYTVYLDRSSIGTVSTGGTGQTISSSTAKGTIGDLGGGGFPFTGSISNLQLYNTSLDAGTVQTLGTRFARGLVTLSEAAEPGVAEDDRGATDDRRRQDHAQRDEPQR